MEALVPHVLLLEDQAMIAAATAEDLADLGCRVIGPAASVAEGLEAVASERIDFALLDLTLPDGSGEEVAAALRTRNIPFALLTAHTPMPDRGGAIRGVPWLEKPARIDELRRVISEGVKRAS